MRHLAGGPHSTSPAVRRGLPIERRFETPRGVQRAQTTTANASLIGRPTISNWPLTGPSPNLGLAGRMFRNLDWQLAFLAYHPAYDIFKLPLSLKNQFCGGSEYRWDYLVILVNLDLMRNMNDKSN